MTKQAYVIKRYLEMGLNVLAHGNSEHIFNVLVDYMEQNIGKQSRINVENALSKQRRVQLCQQQEIRIFKVRTNMDNFHQTYQNINKISVKKRARMTVSRGMISGKIMQLSSRAVIDNSNFNSLRKDSCRVKSTAEQSANTKTLVIVQDLHLGDAPNVAQLAAMLNRNTNQNYFWPERDQEIFFIFNNYTSGHPVRAIPNRLYRHNAIVSLPDLQLPSVFKYRAQLMISEDQSNLPMQLYKIGVFGFNSQFGCHSPYTSFAPKRQKQMQDVEGFAKYIHEGNTSYMQFAIETTLKLPSQFYSKYVVNKLCQNMLSAYHCLQLCQDKQTDNPTIILNRMASLLRKSESTNKLAQRYMPNACANDPNNFYIRERNGQWLEMDSKGIELQASKYISTLPYTQRLLGQIYIKYLWLVLSARVVIVKNDFNHLIGSMSAYVTHRRYKELSRNFYKQIIQAVQELLKSKELNLVFGVPYYLLQHPSFVGFLSSLLGNSQILIQNEPLFDFWWECVEQQQFIENRYNQYHFLKKQIEQAIFNRICFVINISDMELHHIADLICVQKKYDKQRSKDNISQSIDQNILNPYAATAILQLGLNKRAKGSINKYCNQHLYKLFKKVLYINVTFQKQQQLCLIDKLLRIYIEKNKPTQLAIPYMELSIKYLKMIIQQVHAQDNNSSSIYHTSRKHIAKQSNAELENNNLEQKQQNQFIQQNELDNEERNKKSEVFHKVYESINHIMISISEIFQQSKKKEKEDKNYNALSQRVQVFKTNLMINKEREKKIAVGQQVLRLQKKIQEWQQSKRQYQSLTMIYANYSANLSQQLTYQQPNRDKDKANGFDDHVGKKDQVEQSHFDHPPIQKFKNIKKGRYISEQFSHLKDNFIQINCKCGDETVNLPNLTNMKINHGKQQDNQSLKETIRKCLTENNSAQLLNYLEVNINFVRIRRIDKQFVQLLTNKSNTQFQQIVSSLSAYRQLIHNYQSLMRCLQFCYRISQFFKAFIRGKHVIIQNQKIEEQTILAQYKFAEYICLLDILTTCKTIRNSIELKLSNIEKATKILIDCVRFLKQVGNSSFSFISQSSEQEIAEKRIIKSDLLIKLKIYELISGQILSMISNNASIHFTIYKQLQLEKPQNILMVLQYPNFMYPYKWQQIQNQIFNPLLDLNMRKYESKSIQLFQGVSTIGKISKNSLANFINIKPGKAILDKRLSIQFNYNFNHYNSDIPENEGKNHGAAALSNTIQTNLNLCSNLNLNKFIIVYDPYIFLPKFISAECSTEDASYRKITCLSNRKQSETQCEENEKILKINHLPTYYMFYFSIQTKKSSNQYQQTLCKLNQIISLLNRKQKKGQGHNDKLIIVVKHKYLCEDIKNNANFAVDEFRNTPNQNSTNNKNSNDTHIFSENLYNEQPQKNRVKIVHLQLTEMDIIQFLKYGDKKQEKNKIKDLMGSWKRHVGVEDWEKDKRIRNIAKSSCSISGLSGFILKQQQNLHSQFYLCKQYLKSLIAQVLNQDENQNKYSLAQINNSLSRYYSLKQEVLDEFRLKKLIDYNYYLNRQNLCALRCLYTALHFLASNLMLPMDFIWEIGNFTSFQPFIQILASHQLKTIKKEIRQTKINQSDLSETKFLIHKKSQKIKVIKFINELFEEYKYSLSNRMNCIERNLINIQPQKFDAESKKVLQQQIGHYQFFIIVYDIFESWIIKNLLDQYDRSNITIIFDYEPNSYQMYLNFISNPPRMEKKIVFFVHRNHLRSIKDLIHSSRIFWI